MSIIIGTALSILENPYQTEKVREKYDSSYTGFSVFIKVEEIDGVKFYNSIFEWGVGAKSWVFDPDQPPRYSKVYGEHLRNACYIDLVSPIFRDWTGKESKIELCTEPEKSIIKIVCKGWEYKKNKRNGQFQKSKEGQYFIKGKQCLGVESWLLSEVLETEPAAPAVNSTDSTNSNCSVIPESVDGAPSPFNAEVEVNL